MGYGLAVAFSRLKCPVLDRVHSGYIELGSASLSYLGSIDLTIYAHLHLNHDVSVNSWAPDQPRVNRVFVFDYHRVDKVFARLANAHTRRYLERIWRQLV